MQEFHKVLNLISKSQKLCTLDTYYREQGEASATAGLPIADKYDAQDILRLFATHSRECLSEGRVARRFSSRRTLGYEALDLRGRIPALQNPRSRLRVYAYIFVCMYVCRKRRHICVKVSMHAHMSGCYVYSYTCMYVCMYVCT